MVDTATRSTFSSNAPTRVLVVDGPEGHSPNTVGFASALRDEGYAVKVVTGASECLEHFADPPDLVLLGTLRPGMPWTQLCRRMQNKADVPIILATRLESEIDAVLAFELGVAGYLSDPSRTREMIARVRAALRGVSSAYAASDRHREGGTGRGEPLAAGALKIDMVGREVTLHGTTVYLARREFDLLAALLSPPGIVRTRRDLIDAVWQGRGVEGSRTLDTHIRRLRMKLEADPTEPRMLMTVRGVGFIFDLNSTRGTS